MALERELATYQANLMELVANEGRFVVIRGEEIAGVLDTYEEALEAGYEKFGLEPFLVKQIRQSEPIHYFSPGFPAMPILTGVIGPQGPMIEVKIMQSPQRVAALKRAGKPYSSPVVILALLDTGASTTAIDRLVLSGLQLDFRNVISIHTPSTGAAYESRNTFDASIVLGETQSVSLVKTIEVIESDFAIQGFFGLIGRDILCQCVFTYDGPSGDFTIEYS